MARTHHGGGGAGAAGASAAASAQPSQQLARVRADVVASQATSTATTAILAAPCAWTGRNGTASQPITGSGSSAKPGLSR